MGGILGAIKTGEALTSKLNRTQTAFQNSKTFQRSLKDFLTCLKERKTSGNTCTLKFETIVFLTE